MPKLLNGYALDPSVEGLCIYGVVTAVAAGNKFTIPSLAGYGVGKFMGATNPWSAYVLRKGTGTSGAPQGEIELITDFDNTTGEFTTNPFTVAVAANDEILLMNPAFANMLTESESRFQMVVSDVGPVEQNAYEMFTITLFDIAAGGIPSADIDITGISAVLEKSTGGADFSSAGITQPTFLKAAGRVYCSYHFLTAEWAVGDLYRMTVGDITCIVNGQTIYVPTAVWSNVVLTEADIDTVVNAIDTSLGAQSDAATAADLSDITTTSAQAKIRLLLERIAPAALSEVINGATDTDLGKMLGDLATYFKAVGAAMSVTMDNGGATRTDLNDIFADLAAILDGAAGITTWPVSASPANGVNLFAAIRKIYDLVNPAATETGTVFSITKSVTHSDIVAAGVDLTGASTGLLELVTAYAQNGPVAMASAGGTAKLELKNNNVRGSDLYLTDVAEANLGADTTNPLGNSICVLESGKKLSAIAISEDFTSAGTVDIYLVFRRLADAATISPA